MRFLWQQCPTLFDFMTFHDLVQQGVQFGDAQGADYTELRYVQSVVESYSTRNGEIISAGTTETAGIGIRALANGGIGFVSTARLKKEEIERAVKTAIRLARSSKRKTPLVLSEESTVQTKWEVPVKIPFADVSSETKLNRVFEVDKTLTSTFNSDTLPFRLVILALETSKKLIANNEGTQVESDYSLGRYLAMITAKGEKDTEQRMISRGATGGWEWFAAPQFIQSFIDEAQDAKSVADNAKAMTFDKPVDFIVGPEVAGIISHENCGHPSEADRIQGREGMNAGESFWMDIDVGTTRVGSPAVTVIDDPTLPKSGGFYLYDDEGVRPDPDI